MRGDDIWVGPIHDTRGASGWELDSGMTRVSECKGGIVDMSFILGYRSKNHFIIAADSRSVVKGKGGEIVHSWDNERKLFVATTEDGPALFALTGTNRFDGFVTLDMLIGLSRGKRFRETVFSLTQEMRGRLASVQQCQLIAVSADDFENPYYVEVEESREMIEVARLQPGGVIATGEAYARHLALSRFKNMEEKGLQEQADIVIQWVDSMVRMDELLHPLPLAEGSIGGQVNAYIVRRGRIDEYTA